MIVPSKRIVRELRHRVSRAVGRRYRKFHDIRWDDGMGCLCVFERKFNGAESIRRPLRVDDDPHGEPRQAHRGDIEEVLENLYGRRKATDRWYEAMLERRADRKLKQMERRSEMATDAAKEVVRVLKEGLKTYVGGPMKVEDKRRVT